MCAVDGVQLLDTYEQYRIDPKSIVLGKKYRIQQHLRACFAVRICIRLPFPFEPLIATYWTSKIDAILLVCRRLVFARLAGGRMSALTPSKPEDISNLLVMDQEYPAPEI